MNHSLSDEPDENAVRDALPRVWQAGRDYFERHPDFTGAEPLERRGTPGLVR